MVSTVTTYDRMQKKVELVTHEHDGKLHETNEKGFNSGGKCPNWY